MLYVIIINPRLCMASKANNKFCKRKLVALAVMTPSFNWMGSEDFRIM